MYFVLGSASCAVMTFAGLKPGPVRAEMMKLFSNSVVEMSTTTASAISPCHKDLTQTGAALTARSLAGGLLKGAMTSSLAFSNRRRKTEDQAAQQRDS